MLRFPRSYLLFNTAAIGGFVSGGGGGGPAGPVNVLSASGGDLTGLNTKAFTTTAAVPVGALCIVAVLSHGDAPSSFTDSSSQTWTSVDEQISSTDLTLYTCTVGGSGIPSGATLTVNWTFANQSTGCISCDYFTGFSSFPGTNDGGGSGVSGGESTTVTGPTVSTSYQFFVQAYSTSGGPNGPDGGSDGSWTHWKSTASLDFVMNSYYRIASDTGSTIINTTPGGFSTFANYWFELKI